MSPAHDAHDNAVRERHKPPTGGQTQAARPAGHAAVTAAVAAAGPVHGEGAEAPSVCRALSEHGTHVRSFDPQRGPAKPTPTAPSLRGPGV